MADSIIDIVPSNIKEKIIQLSRDLFSILDVNIDGKPLGRTDVSNRIRAHEHFILIVNLLKRVESLELMDRYIIESYFLELIN